MLLCASLTNDLGSPNFTRITEEVAFCREVSLRSLIAAPALADLIATVLMYLGLVTITASVYQMLRGAELDKSKARNVPARPTNHVHFVPRATNCTPFALLGDQSHTFRVTTYVRGSCLPTLKEQSSIPADPRSDPLSDPPSDPLSEVRLARASARHDMRVRAD
eukprot:2338126-Pyramimonas_sp.AAC.2